jgi:hypothetical protein
LHPGIVSMRVVFVLRSAEIFPVFLRFVLPFCVGQFKAGIEGPDLGFRFQLFFVTRFFDKWVFDSEVVWRSP